MELLKLIEVPDDQRDVQWEYRFFDALAASKLRVIAMDPQQGPDGWPYLLVETAEDAFEPAVKIIEWLSMRGIGMAVNPTKNYPDFVFNYGMLWHFKEKGRFVIPQAEVPAGTTEIEAGKGLLAGPPTKEYLPDYVRGILREFFRDQSLLAVKILVMSTDRKHFDLAVSLESLGNPPPQEHAGIAESIAWFLPPHYSLLLVSESGLPQFTDL